jgi:hypothetical protein
MERRAQQADVWAAVDDLRRRTLSHFARPLDRLIYLASTRDYNTGVYYHDGLAATYNQDVACQALSECHREAFRQLLGTSLSDLVDQMECYMDSVHLSTDTFIASWKKLEPYRVTVPVESDPLAVEFFFANLRTALAILETRQKTVRPPLGRAASPAQSLGR